MDSELCEKCPLRVDCLLTTCLAAKLVMEMVLGDYLSVLHSHQHRLGEEENDQFIQNFVVGCIAICNQFNINYWSLDTDKILYSVFKELK